MFSCLLTQLDNFNVTYKFCYLDKHPTLTAYLRLSPPASSEMCCCM